jgi:hypothetical protein
MKALLALFVLGACSPSQINFLDDGKAVEVVSIRFIHPLTETPGAVGVPYFENVSERIKEVKDKDLWFKCESESVKAIRSIDLMAIRLRVVLANGTQILMDESGRFIQTSVRSKAVTRWTGAVRELRASQYNRLIHEIQALK